MAFALVGGLFVGGTVAAPSASAACISTPTGGTVTRSLPGSFRSYNLRVPAGLTERAPLLIDLHGFLSFPFGQEFTSGWSQHADQNKFIVAYPAGTWNTWNFAANSPDITFLRAVVGQIQLKYCVDAGRIYASGGSFGGLMAQRLACSASDLFAAAAPTISGPLNPCTLTRPVAVAITNTSNDPIFPLATSAIPNRDQWMARNGCSTTPTTDPNPYGQYGQVFDDCNGDGAVLFRTYNGGGHAYPTGAALVDLKTKVWNFLMAHPKP